MLERHCRAFVGEQPQHREAGGLWNHPKRVIWPPESNLPARHLGGLERRRDPRRAEARQQKLDNRRPSSVNLVCSGGAVKNARGGVLALLLPAGRAGACALKAAVAHRLELQGSCLRLSARRTAACRQRRSRTTPIQPSVDECFGTNPTRLPAAAYCGIATGDRQPARLRASTACSVRGTRPQRAT